MKNLLRIPQMIFLYATFTILLITTQTNQPSANDEYWRSYYAQHPDLAEAPEYPDPTEYEDDGHPNSEENSKRWHNFFLERAEQQEAERHAASLRQSRLDQFHDHYRKKITGLSPDEIKQLDVTRLSLYQLQDILPQLTISQLSDLDNEMADQLHGLKLLSPQQIRTLQEFKILPKDLPKSLPTPVPAQQEDDDDGSTALEKLTDQRFLKHATLIKIQPLARTLTIPELVQIAHNSNLSDEQIDLILSGLQRRQLELLLQQHIPSKIRNMTTTTLSNY